MAAARGLPTQTFTRPSRPGGWPPPAPELFDPVREELVCGWAKPSSGGMWTSTLLPDGSSNWVHALLEMSGLPAVELEVWHLTPDPNARVYEIDRAQDLLDLGERFPPRCDHHQTPCPPGMGPARVGWRAIANEYDAVHLTARGLAELDFAWPTLRSWDCESTLWFRWAFPATAHLGNVRFERLTEKEPA